MEEGLILKSSIPFKISSQYYYVTLSFYQFIFVNRCPASEYKSIMDPKEQASTSKHTPLTCTSCLDQTAEDDSDDDW